MEKKQIQFWKVAAKEGLIADSANPLLAMQSISSDILCQFSNGKLDVMELVRMELEARSINPATGLWEAKKKTSPEKIEASKKSRAKKAADKKVAEPVATK